MEFFDGAVLELLLWGGNILLLWCSSAVVQNIIRVLIHIFILANMATIFGSDNYI